MWKFIHNAVAHPLMSIFRESSWTVRFHDWTADIAWPPKEEFPGHTCTTYIGDRKVTLDVEKLWELSAELESEVWEISHIPDFDKHWLDGWCWGRGFTHRKFIEHMRRVDEADLSYPVILGPHYRLLDGMHRISKVLLEGGDSVRVVVVENIPEEAILMEVLNA